MLLKTIKNWSSILIAMLFVIVIVSCGDDDEPNMPSIEIDSFATTIDENPSAGMVLGTVNATTTSGSIVFAIDNQTPDGAMAIDAITGELTVTNTVLWDFETNPTLTATISASVDNVSETATATVTLNNVAELVNASPFTATIDENPNAGEDLGSVSASVDVGTVTYSILSQTPVGALTVNPTTGQLTVADATAFDFETNPTITATYEASNGTVNGQAMITITLENVAETISGERFTTTIDENPANGSSLGRVNVTTDAESVIYSIITDNLLSGETPGAFSINATTGRISVADSAFFDFETRQTVTARYQAVGDGDTGFSTISQIEISLNNLNDVDLPPVFTKVEARFVGFSTPYSSINGSDYVLVNTELSDGEQPSFQIFDQDETSSYSIELTGILDESDVKVFELTRISSNGTSGFFTFSDVAAVDLGYDQFTAMIIENNTGQKLELQRDSNSGSEPLGIRFYDRNSPSSFGLPRFTNPDNFQDITAIFGGIRIRVGFSPVPSSEAGGIYLVLYDANGSFFARVRRYSGTGSGGNTQNNFYQLSGPLQTGSYFLRLEKYAANGVDIEKASVFREFSNN